MYAYAAYGLGIDSSLELPELVKREDRGSEPDVVIEFGPVDFENRPADAGGSDWIWATADEACVQMPECARFHVRGGKKITVEPQDGADPAHLRLNFLGPVLSLLLHQRGYMLLHSSCIALPEGAVAFVADKGTGKSTLAAAFVQRGFSIVADDIIAVDAGAKHPTPIVHPAFPQMKLWPDALTGLGQDYSQLPTINSYVDKRSRRADKFADAAMPLRGIYVLTDGGETATQVAEPLKGHAAFRELCNHSYVLSLLKATDKLAHHFNQTVELIKKVPIRKLVRRKQHSALGELIELVQQDVRGSVGQHHVAQHVA